jgi:iron complex transport system substrate-binding protein
MVLAPARADVAITDDRGVRVVFDASPRRVVSLLPSLTETVCALGRCEQLVGVDRYSNWPAPVLRLPQMGGGIDPQIEAVVAARPDVVLAAQSTRGLARLEALGLKVLAIEPKTHAQARQAFERLGQLLEVPEANRLWARIDAGVDQAARSLPATARGQRVYFEVNRGPYAAGPQSFLGETLGRLGLGNIVPAGLGPFPLLNPEFVVRAGPDLIMVGDRGLERLEDRPGWAGLAAVRGQRVCVFSAGQGDVLVRPGPRMDEAARLIADCVRALPPPAPGSRP